MLELIFQYLPQVAPYIFGAGGLMAYFQERKKRKVELSHKEAGALQSMQTAYDDFVKDAKAITESLKIEVSELKAELKEVKQDFRDYRQDHKNCA